MPLATLVLCSSTSPKVQKLASHNSSSTEDKYACHPYPGPEFFPNLNIVADVGRYRVDSVITEEYIPPNEDNCIEMQCFSLPTWQTLLGKSDCCGDYATIWMQCVPGTAEYNNADLQDADTGISGCVDPDMTFGDTEFNNAEMTMDMMSTEPNPCSV